MVYILYFGLILFFAFWYLSSKQRQRDKANKIVDDRSAILSNVEKELYRYALKNNKIGKKIVPDAEIEGGALPYFDNEKDVQKVYELVDKYKANILQERYASYIEIYRPLLPGQFMASSYTIPNQLEYIIPFLKTEIDKFPDAKDYYYKI